jgi:hypothetical protein
MEAAMGRYMVHNKFSANDIKAMKPVMKVGLLATVDAEGLPHITLLSSLQANTPTQMIFGQFTEGLSKGHIRDNPRVGFLIMTLDREFWCGKATFTHTATQGPEFEMYNSIPMFRYNAYFGVHTVYYLDLVEHTGQKALPMGRIVLAAIQTIVARTFSGMQSEKPVLNIWTRGLMNKLDNLKFLAYVCDDGYPAVIPAIQAQAADREHIVFSTAAFREELSTIPQGASLAVFGLSLDMEDVLMRGEFLGIGRMAGVRCGRVRINWVYNPMPPKPQQIYPELALERIAAF